jgi:dCTP deaminase
MPFLSDETWRAKECIARIVEPFDEKNLEEAKYVLAIGGEIYISSSAKDNTIRQLKADESFVLAPGQFAYILTDEVIRMPFDKIGFISINAKVKFNGLVNISGFHVDPGYHGRLLFSVFNAGPILIHLNRGKRIFPLWIAALDVPTKSKTPKDGYMTIPTELVTAVSGNFTTAFEVSDVVEKMRKEFDESVRKLRTDLDETRLDVSTVKATRIQLLVFVGFFALLLGGLMTAGSRMIYNWVTAGRPDETRIFVAVPPVTSLPQALPVPQPQPTPTAPAPKPPP